MIQLYNKKKKKKFYYIGALGSKKTHTNRCERLKNAGYNEGEIKSIK